MSGDVVERLRAHKLASSDGIHKVDILRAPTALDIEAAAEIEQLKHDIARYVEANTALMAERASLIETKREQIDRLLDANIGEQIKAGQIGLELEAAERLLAEARAALEPFADAVFNDNGDVTYNLSAFTTDDLFRAYSIARRARTLTNGGENGR